MDGSNYLGLDIQYDRAEGVLRIDQQKYLMKILARFGMLDCSTRKTPMAGDYRKRLRKRDDLEKYPVCRERQRLYQGPRVERSRAARSGAAGHGCDRGVCDKVGVEP